jgi:hypothetical protein
MGTGREGGTGSEGQGVRDSGGREGERYRKRGTGREGQGVRDSGGREGEGDRKRGTERGVGRGWGRVKIR